MYDREARLHAGKKHDHHVDATLDRRGGSMRWFPLGGHGLACVSGTALLGLRMPLSTGCA